MTWFLNVSEAGGDLIIWFYQLSCLIRSDEGLMLEMSAFESLYGGQFTQLIKKLSSLNLVQFKKSLVERCSMEQKKVSEHACS